MWLTAFHADLAYRPPVSPTAPTNSSSTRSASAPASLSTTRVRSLLFLSLSLFRASALPASVARILADRIVAPWLRTTRLAQMQPPQ